MHVVSRADAVRRAGEVPVAYQVFDLLSFDGTDAITLPYLERRRLLAAVVQPGRSWAVPAHHIGGGGDLLAVVADRGLEGLVAKRVDSVYLPGRRSPSWRKLKVRRQQEFVVGGWAQGDGRRAGMMGSLLVGYYDDGGVLRYAGRVGTGFTEAELRRLMGLLQPLEREPCPFVPLPDVGQRRGARWVEPQLVVEVAYGEWTEDGVLRHPAYLGQRDDKDAREVTKAL
jgi:bifunctional non-homologous end joining protein LigD